MCPAVLPMMLLLIEASMLSSSAPPTTTSIVPTRMMTPMMMFSLVAKRFRSARRTRTRKWLPISELNYRVGMGHDLGVMGGEDEGGPALLVERLHQIDDVVAGDGVQVRGGLIGEDNPRLGDECASDRNPLPLPAGELVGAVIDVRSDPAWRACAAATTETPRSERR